MKNDKSQTQEIPSTDFVGSITIAGQKIPCAVLYPESEKPIRVFIQREITGLLTGNKKGGLDRYLLPENLQPFIPEKFKLKKFSENVMLMRFRGRKAQGFVGEDIIDLCYMYLDARTAGKLRDDQKQLAIKSDIIVKAFAKTGVDSVIDEATGYEAFRPRFALNRILERYIDEEVRRWYKKFPDKFYQLIYKLNGWQWTDESYKRKFSIVGKWTNNIIYARFPKGVLGKLKVNNPVTENGYRRYKHHQLLTDIGNDELREYISNAIFLMESCANWSKFKRALARATGQPYDGDLFEVQ